MILSKKFDCTIEDLDSLVVALAEEIKDGWHIAEIERHGVNISYSIKRTEPDFSITLVRKDAGLVSKASIQ